MLHNLPLYEVADITIKYKTQKKKLIIQQQVLSTTAPTHYIFEDAEIREIVDLTTQKRQNSQIPKKKKNVAVKYNKMEILYLKSRPQINKTPLVVRLIIPFNAHPLNNLHKVCSKRLEHIIITQPRLIQHMYICE